MTNSSEHLRGRQSSAGALVVVAAFFGVMVSFGSLLVFTFSVFLKPLSQEFGWSRESISNAFGLAAITVAICSPKLGQLLDRHGPKKIILPCMIVFGAAILSLAWLTPHIWHLYATFVLLGVVGNGTTQMGYSRAVSTWFDERRGMALALVMAGTGAGSIILPALAQAIISNYGWRTAYIVLGLMVFVFGVPLTALFVREKERSLITPVQGGAAMAVPGVSTATGLKSRPFWILVGSLFLGSISVNGALTHMSALLTDRGISIESATLALAVLGAFSFGGRILTGYLLDKFFGPRVAFVVLAATAGGILLLSRAATSYTGWGAAALIGIGLGAEADITPYLLTRYFGLGSFSTLYGFTWTAYAIAGGVGPILMGRAFDLTGSYTAFLSLMSASTFIAAALMLFMPSYRVPKGSNDPVQREGVTV